MKSKNRTCTCWSKIKPQDGGLKFFFKTKFKTQTATGKREKSRVVLVEVGSGEGQRLSLCPLPHFLPESR